MYLTFDYSLSILNSNVFYEKLDKSVDAIIYDNEEFWNRFIKQSCINKIGIFNTILNALHYVAYLNKDDGVFFNERWNYLYFWVGTKALKNVTQNCPFSNVISILKSVKERINKIPYKYNIENISEKEFNDLKVVYDYFVNYASIQFNHSSPDSACTHEYKKYVDSSFDAYVKLNEECRQNGEKDYCKYFKHFIEKNNYENLQKVTCNGKKPPLSVEQYRKLHLSDAQPEVELEGGIQIPNDGTEMHTRGISTSETSDNMMSTYFPILGIFSILFLLYNYIPFRTWLHNFLPKKEIIRHDLYEDESEELLENEYELSDRNSQYNRHDINYHSIVNS
ncbi:PIR Superfamily Protein [Plasmodium ovale curtisi]|uniref:PIR Superfamily Protein n=1 Tax=Plasmodium ovale curtisi TaxID=864141 RepID=A0A1A8WDA4_PLAOA|nr:PIR Superfamily Protein [Plasmodium ovale curtisi]